MVASHTFCTSGMVLVFAERNRWGVVTGPSLFVEDEESGGGVGHTSVLTDT
jgi:hypothetical protein